jgi:hypothetical protein
MSDPFAGLAPRDKEPNTGTNFLNWLAQAANRQQMAPKRLSRIVANGIVIAALQRASHDDGKSLFLIKGGTQIELRLGLRARASADLDTLFRGEFSTFLAALDEVLLDGLGPFTLQRTEPEDIDVASRTVNPRRMNVGIGLRGRTVLTVQLEVAPDEAGAGKTVDMIPVPSLEHFGISSPGLAAALALEYQVAQKLHACTDPHTDERANLRVHDVVDLHLVRTTFFADGVPPLLREACLAVFDARAQEAAATGRDPRPWPPVVEAHGHWRQPDERLARELGLGLTFGEAITGLNRWIREIDGGHGHSAPDHLA